MTDVCERTLAALKEHVEAEMPTTHAFMAPNRVMIPATGRTGFWNLMARVEEDPDTLCCSITCPLKTPPRRRTEMALFLTRANWCMTVGGFEMDLGDGEVRMKLNVPLTTFPLVPSDFDRIIGTASYMMDHYLPAIMQVIDGRPADQAAADCDSERNAPNERGFFGRIQQRQDGAPPDAGDTEPPKGLAPDTN